jgi:3-hydroxyisobutyrate dehydrogenase
VPAAGGRGAVPAAGGPVAVCGTGLMGAAIAGRLLDHGVPTTVWNRHPERAAELARRGARLADSPAAAADGAAAVLTLLGTPEAVAEVVGGPTGIARARPGVLVQMSTVGVEDVLALRAELATEVDLLDAPVLGSWAQAAAGRLRILTGGEPAAVARWRPLLALLGEVVPVGGIPAGTALKHVVNAAVAPMVALLAEAVALGDHLGLDPGLVLDELELSRLGPLVSRKRDMLETGRFPPDARLGTFGKDMRLVEEAGEARGLAMTMAASARRRAEQAVAAGLADRDYSVLVAHVRGTAGCG